jgi:hypothetical protein
LTVMRRSNSRGKMRSSDHARSSDAKMVRFSYAPLVLVLGFLGVGFGCVGCCLVLGERQERGGWR